MGKWEIYHYVLNNGKIIRETVGFVVDIEENVKLLVDRINVKNKENYKYENAINTYSEILKGNII